MSQVVSTVYKVPFSAVSRANSVQATCKRSAEFRCIAQWRMNAETKMELVTERKCIAIAANSFFREKDSVGEEESILA